MGKLEFSKPPQKSKALSPLLGLSCCDRKTSSAWEADEEKSTPSPDFTQLQLPKVGQWRQAEPLLSATRPEVSAKPAPQFSFRIRKQIQPSKCLLKICTPAERALWGAFCTAQPRGPRPTRLAKGRA